MDFRLVFRDFHHPVPLRGPPLLREEGIYHLLFHFRLLLLKKEGCTTPSRFAVHPSSERRGFTIPPSLSLGHPSSERRGVFLCALRSAQLPQRGGGDVLIRPSGTFS